MPSSCFVRAARRSDDPTLTVGRCAALEHDTVTIVEPDGVRTRPLQSYGAQVLSKGFISARVSTSAGVALCSPRHGAHSDIQQQQRLLVRHCRPEYGLPPEPRICTCLSQATIPGSVADKHCQDSGLEPASLVLTPLRPINATRRCGLPIQVDPLPSPVGPNPTVLTPVLFLCSTYSLNAPESYSHLPADERHRRRLVCRGVRAQRMVLVP